MSLVKGERIRRNITKMFSDVDLRDLWIPFFCVSTNLTRCRTEVHDRLDAATAIRASVAIPGILPPVPFDGDLLVDGGVLNNLPCDVMRASGTVSRLIAVDLSPTVGPRAHEDYGLSVSGWKALRAQFGSSQPQFPRLLAVLMRALVAGSVRDRDRLLADGSVDWYLDLELAGVQLLDFERVVEIADRGYEAARPRLEALVAAQPPDPERLASESFPAEPFWAQKFPTVAKNRAQIGVRQPAPPVCIRCRRMAERRRFRQLRRVFWLAAIIGAVVGVRRMAERRHAAPQLGSPASWPPLEPSEVPVAAVGDLVTRRAGAAGDRSRSSDVPVAPVGALVADEAAVEVLEPADGEPWVPAVDGACPASHPIKANANSRIYHVPGGRSYARTQASDATPRRPTPRPTATVRPRDRDRPPKIGAHVRVIVDYDVCASTGSCMQVCPEVFEVRSDGYLYVLQDEPPPELHDRVREAADLCPTGAITVED